MAERQVSVGSHSYALDSLFLVMATQNPLEQEGTYPLPEAQLDRFLMHVNVDYPSAEAELAILRSVRNEAQGEQSAAPQISQQAIFSARQQALDIHMADAVEQYIVQLVVATRNAGQWDQQLDQWLDVGASPRATIALDRCSRAHAWLAGRDYVSPDDVQAVAHDVLRHRLIISFAAEAEGVARDQLIDRLIHCVPVA
jgi:MoxR-like ATPase